MVLGIVNAIFSVYSKTLLHQKKFYYITDNWCSKYWCWIVAGYLKAIPNLNSKNGNKQCRKGYE